MSRLFIGLGDGFHRLGRHSRSRKRERYEETKHWTLVWGAKISVLFLGPLLQVILWSPRDKLSLQSPSLSVLVFLLVGLSWLSNSSPKQEETPFSSFCTEQITPNLIQITSLTFPFYLTPFFCFKNIL